MLHMTQIANPVTLLASPLGEEGHEVAKGWTVVILIMILDVDVTAEGGIIKLIAREGNPPPFEPFEPSYNMFGRGRLEDLSLLDLSPLQHEHAFGIMVIGAIEDIPLNPV